MKMKHIKHKWLDAFGWKDGVLEVWFKAGDVYEFYGVSEDTHEALFKNKQYGLNFNRLIRDKYVYHQLV